MPDVLAHDVNGRPLRAGDPVRIIAVVNSIAAEFDLVGRETTIRGSCPISPPEMETVEIDIPHPLADVSESLGYWSAQGEHLKRIDEPEREEVEETTGYRPEDMPCETV